MGKKEWGSLDDLVHAIVKVNGDAPDKGVDPLSIAAAALRASFVLTRMQLVAPDHRSHLAALGDDPLVKEVTHQIGAAVSAMADQGWKYHTVYPQQLELSQTFGFAIEMEGRLLNHDEIFRVAAYCWKNAYGWNIRKAWQYRFDREAYDAEHFALKLRLAAAWLTSLVRSQDLIGTIPDAAFEQTPPNVQKTVMNILSIFSKTMS